MRQQFFIFMIFPLYIVLANLACTPEHAGATDSAVPDAFFYDAGNSDAITIDGSSVDHSMIDSAGRDAAQDIDAGPVPQTWACPPEFWSDNDCDCGCGALDPSCPDALASACDYNFCPNQAPPLETQNWLCGDVPDAGPTDSSLPDTAQPDSAQADSAVVDTGPPPLQRGEGCTSLGADDCAPGLVCTPSGSCQEPCATEFCDANEGFCWSTSPDYVCRDNTYSYCVEGEGGLQLCRDMEINFTQAFCANGSSEYVWFFHSQFDLPEGCWEGWVEFTTSHICISAVTDNQLTALGHDLTVITDDPSGYTNDDNCDYFSEIELNSLTVIGGDLEVGSVSGHTPESDLQVDFSTLELPALEAVYGGVEYREAPSVTHINTPALKLIGGFMVLDDLPAMHTVYMPNLEVIEGGLRIHDLPALTTLNLQNLRRIDGYVSILNVPCVDSDVIDAIAAKATGPVSLNNVGTGVGCN